MDAVGAVLVALAVVAAILIFMWLTVHIVQQGEAIVVERLGRFDRVMSPGWNFVWPFIESVRTLAWSRTYISDRGAIVDTVETISCVDLRESIFNFKRQEVYTKDTVQVEVNAVMYHRIMDVKRAIYEVDDIVNAVQGVAQTQLKEVFGSMSLAEALSSQKAINEHMQRNFAPVFAAWGLEVLRIELLDLKPVDGSDTATSMKQQMKAERMRRAQFIEAEGKKAAMRLESEGVKRVLVNKGVAEQEATRRISDGNATALKERARAEKAALDAVADVMRSEGCSSTDFMLAQRFNGLLDSVARCASGRTLYLPYDATAISGLIPSLPSVFGRHRAPGARPALPAPLASAAGGASAPRRTGEPGADKDLD